jgi:hypothetical protein
VQEATGVAPETAPAPGRQDVPHRISLGAVGTGAADGGGDGDKISVAVLIAIVVSAVALFAILAGLAMFAFTRYRGKGAPRAQQQKKAAAVGPERDGHGDPAFGKSFTAGSPVEVRQACFC